MFNIKSIKTQLIIYLICLAAFISVKDKNSAFLYTSLAAVASAVIVEAVIVYLKTKKFLISESAVITGLIAGYVLSSDQSWLIFTCASVLAILSKHLIRFQNKHIFNPAALGVFLTIVIFGASTEWKGTYIWYIVVPAGIYFAHRIRKIELIIGYAVISLLIFLTQAFSQKLPVWNIFGYYSYFYIFVMVIEPKTTPVKAMGKYGFGAFLAALIFILTEKGVKFDAELFSLLAMNASVPLLGKIFNKKGGTT